MHFTEQTRYRSKAKKQKSANHKPCEWRKTERIRLLKCRWKSTATDTLSALCPTNGITQLQVPEPANELQCKSKIQFRLLHLIEQLLLFDRSLEINYPLNYVLNGSHYNRTFSCQSFLRIHSRASTILSSICYMERLTVSGGSAEMLILPHRTHEHVQSDIWLEDEITTS